MTTTEKTNPITSNASAEAFANGEEERQAVLGIAQGESYQRARDLVSETAPIAPRPTPKTQQPFAKTNPISTHSDPRIKYLHYIQHGQLLK